MTLCEIDSFVTKFKHLCQAGFVATLTVEAVDGKASVTLKSDLGPISPPYHAPRHGQPRGPSYQRRQERHQAAREAAAAGQVGRQASLEPFSRISLILISLLRKVTFRRKTKQTNMQRS